MSLGLWLALSAVSPLQNAVDLYQQARFAESAAVLDSLLATEPAVPVKKQAKLYLGMNFFSLGNTERARATLNELFDLDPDFELPTFASPSVRRFFAEAKKKHRVVPIITHTPPAQLDAQTGGHLDFQLDRMRPGYTPSLFFRRASGESYASLDLVLQKDDRYAVQLPSSLLMREQPYVFEYFVKIDQPELGTVAALRSEKTPFQIPVSIPVVGTPIYKRWWLWTVVGVVVAGAGATTAYFLLRPTTGSADVSFKAATR